MSFLSRLFGHAPTREDSARATAPAMGNEQSKQAAEIGSSAATVDIAKLEFGERLIGLAYDPQDGATQRTAQRRLAQLVDANVIRIGQLPRGPREDPIVIAIAALCEQTGPFEAVAPQIKEPTTWLKLAVDGGSARLRQLAAQRIEDPEQLRALVRAARERDKSVYRIAKSKLDELHAQEKRGEAARAHKRSIAETIDRHSYKPFDGAYVATLEHLVAEWQSRDATLPDEVQNRVSAAIDRARDVIANHIRMAGAQAARETAIANAGPLRQRALIELRKMLATLLAAEATEPTIADNTRERLAALDERWQMTLEYKPAAAEEVVQLHALRDAMQQVADNIVAIGTLQQQLTALEASPAAEDFARLAQFLAPSTLLAEEEVPALVLRARQLVAEQAAREAERLTAHAAAERQIAQLVRKAQQALTEGRSRQAMGVRNSIERKLGSLQRVPKALAERLHHLDERLRELQDWKQFAVTPKRSELIEQMRALIGSDEPPAQLAERIKRLQEEWKSLAQGTLDSDEDWERFHAAAQAAYEPCRQYFAAQAQQREQNLERRKALLARLAEYERSTDWEHVDWKNVAHAVRSAKQEWRDASPTERAVTKAIEQAFATLIERVDGRLAAEYAANLERKQLLVKQAQRLATQTDLAQAAADVKRLQHAWREVGLTPHREGQALWEEFKRACDAVFEKRRQEHAERNALHEQSEAQAVALCEEAEALSQRASAELSAGAARIRELRESFAAMELPPHKRQSLQRRFGRALDEFERALGRQKRLDVQRAWEQLFALADRARLRLLEGRDAAAITDELREVIVAAKQGPKGGEAALERKLQSSRDTLANEVSCRDLVIRAEIAADVTTPELDQPRRREMQLQALVQRHAAPPASKREQLELLAFELVALGPVPSPAYETLFGRFRRAFDQAY